MDGYVENCTKNMKKMKF